MDEIDDAIVLAERAEDYRIEYNELRPHEAISWNRPKEVHPGPGRPHHPDIQNQGNPANYLTRDSPPHPTPSSRAMSMSCTSVVPSPTSRIFESR
ncbi:hypothetical protein NLM24_43110 [Nocardia zapadnayensis]|nr:hypothetical protein [Nocardia zapadnayensis]MCX0277277.1 hypothetical protein [Nocardia zapadnayensis]